MTLRAVHWPEQASKACLELHRKRKRNHGNTCGQILQSQTRDHLGRDASILENSSGGAIVCRPRCVCARHCVAVTPAMAAVDACVWCGVRCLTDLGDGGGTWDWWCLPVSKDLVAPLGSRSIDERSALEKAGSTGPTYQGTDFKLRIREVSASITGVGHEAFLISRRLGTWLPAVDRPG